MSAVVGAERQLERGEGASLAALARPSAAVGYLLLALILAGALFEGWLLVALGRGLPGVTVAGLALDDLVKGARNIAYLALGATTAVHLLSVGRLRRFVQPADIAFAALIGALVIAAIAGGSSLSLSAHGIFVYLRGAIVLYAVRALAPTWLTGRRFLVALGAVVLASVPVAVAEIVGGAPLNEALGFGGATWAGERAQGLLSHPNHLGHVAGLAMLGILALNIHRPRPRWWWIYGALAFGLALSQSRESLLGVIAGIVAMLVLQSGRARRIVIALAIVVGVTGVTWTLQPGAWDALAQKIRGVGSAVETPSGAQPVRPCDPALEECTPAGIASRSIRVLYYQQGLRLWLASPIVGYGVGQFGGGVASQHNPEWNQNPRFGPGGFDLHGFRVTQVDSFWLHLLVETGALGFAAYLAWLGLLAVPAVRRTWRSGAPEAGLEAPGVGLDRWLPAALLLACVVAGFSPSLEDPVMPPLLFGAIGLAWAMRERETSGGDGEVAAQQQPSG